MKISQRRARWLALGLAAIVLVHFGASAFRRYLHCQSMAQDYVLGESLCRQRANVCDELALRLREVGVMAREMARSATSDFERSKWLKMADVEEAKATAANREAIESIRRAEIRASRADAFSRASWRPWAPEPD